MKASRSLLAIFSTAATQSYRKGHREFSPVIFSESSAPLRCVVFSLAATPEILKVEPPNWWANDDSRAQT